MRRASSSRRYQTRLANWGKNNKLSLMSLIRQFVTLIHEKPDEDIRVCLPCINSYDKSCFRYQRRWGVCRNPEPCGEQSEIYWPKDDKCYPKLSRGPCPRGELLVSDEDGLATCSCSTSGELGRYHWLGNGGGCHEHYTKGPCSEPGELFLPGGTCGCHSQLPHYHEPSGMCYQLGELLPVICF